MGPALDTRSSYSPVDAWLRPSDACAIGSVPDSFAKFAYAVGPLVVCYFLTAVLVLVPGRAARYARLALLPLTVAAALDGGTSRCYFYNARELRHLNLGICLFHITFVLRCTEWTFSKAPLRRVPGPHGARGLFVDAFDLMLSARGLGWEWGKGCHVPAEWRDTASRAAFLRQTAWSALKNWVSFDLAFSAIQLLRPHTHAASTPLGWSIFDPTASTPAYILRLLANSLCIATTVYGADSFAYNLSTLLFVGVLGDDAARWPPLFDAPWAMTSLANFWSRRWHQLFRRLFVVFGGAPGTALGGRVGGVLAAFLVSGLLHDGALWGLRGGTDVRHLTLYFVLQAVFLLLEGSVSRALGFRVGGTAGRAWATTVIFASGFLLADSWMTRGLGYAIFLPRALRPGWFLLHDALAFRPFEPLL